VMVSKSISKNAVAHFAPAPEKTNDEVVVSVNNISKKFCKNLKRSMIYGIKDLGSNLLGRSKESTRLLKDEFWALRDISFELKRGEVLGLIGVNGSGKTTLLRMLAGIFPPDKGEIQIKGRVGALIAVGAGFHPHMTGRENIYLNGSILGMSRAEINSKFAEIVEFSELQDFLDAPISTYSSGMCVRLGFAIAIQIQPDVMLIDEVLAVGDTGFRIKCFNAIDKIQKQSAIIFVSHAMPQVARVSTRIMLMNKGEAVYQGSNVTEGIRRYASYFKDRTGIITETDKAKIHEIVLESRGRKNITEIGYMDDLVVHLSLSVERKINNPIVGVFFLNQEFQIIAQCNSYYHKIPIYNKGRMLKITIILPKINLNPGEYLFGASVNDSNRVAVLTSHYGTKKLKVVGEFVGHAPTQFKGEWTVRTS